MPKYHNLNPYTYPSKNSLFRSTVADDGKVDGVEYCTTDYPHAVYRDQRSIMELAEQAFQGWIGALKENSDVLSKKTWDNNAAEGKRLYVSAFTNAYIEKVAELDKRAGRTPTPLATSSTQGATLTLTRVERKPNEYAYYIELSDPGHIDGIQTAEIVYPLGEVEPAQAFASAGYSISTADSTPSYKAIVPLPTSQQQKGSRLFVRNVKKK